MDFVKHIRDLLYLHDCVIVPGFGGFVSNYRPAEINFAQNSFSPPTKSISFNRALLNNDGLLISHVSDRTGMGYVDVKRNLDEFVGSVIRRIEEGNKVSFEEIGSFRIDRHKLIQFEPDLTTNFLLDTWGMSWFQANPLQEYDVKKRIFRDREPEPRRKLSRTAKRILIGVPFLVALALIPMQLNRMEKLNLDLSSLNFLEKNKTGISVADRASEEMAVFEAVLDEGSQETAIAGSPDESGAADLKATPAVESDPPETSASRYYIVVGSFQSVENAYTLQRELSTKGYSSRVLEPASGGLFRVTLGEYQDKDSALVALARVRKTPGREQSWVLKH